METDTQKHILFQKHLTDETKNRNILGEPNERKCHRISMGKIWRFSTKIIQTSFGMANNCTVLKTN